MTEPARSVMQEAHDLVYGDREADYGDPRHNYEVIAALWSAYLEEPVTAADVTMMLALMKVGRWVTGKKKRDTLVDLAGYAGVTERIAFPAEEDGG